MLCFDRRFISVAVLLIGLTVVCAVPESADVNTDGEATVKPCVFVSGASGYVASHIIRQLIDSDKYTVRGSVRSLSNKAKVNHLLDQFPGLELFEADLLSAGSFDAGIKGCDYVMHTASPFQIDVQNVQRDLVQPAVQGTQNVLAAAKAAGTVRRVVVTSSCAAVVNEGFDEDHIHTEADWNSDSTDVSPYSGYRLSKVLAEQAAWDVSKSADFDVIVINPSFILGPPLSVRTDSTSVKVVKKLLDGSYAAAGGVPATGAGAVNVLDVAQAHIRAMENPEAEGRYILSSTIGFSFKKIGDTLRGVEGLAAFHSNIPTTETGGPAKIAKYDHSKAEKDLGITFRSVEDAVADMGLFLLENGMLDA